VRRPWLVNELRFNAVHCAETFECLQEVLHQQLIDIMFDFDNKRKTFEYVGVGRDDGYEAGDVRHVSQPSMP